MCMDESKDKMAKTIMDAAIARVVEEYKDYVPPPPPPPPKPSIRCVEHVTKWFSDDYDIWEYVDEIGNVYRSTWFYQRRGPFLNWIYTERSAWVDKDGNSPTKKLRLYVWAEEEKRQEQFRRAKAKKELW